MKTVSDGQVRQRMVVEDGQLKVARDTDPAYARTILESNKRLQIEEPHRADVRMHLQMSPEQWHRLVLTYPELHHGTADEKRRAWEKVARMYPQIVAKDFRGKFYG